MLPPTTNSFSTHLNNCSKRHKSKELASRQKLFYSIFCRRMSPFEVCFYFIRSLFPFSIATNRLITPLKSLSFSHTGIIYIDNSSLPFNREGWTLVELSGTDLGYYLLCLCKYCSVSTFTANFQSNTIINNNGFSRNHQSGDKEIQPWTRQTSLNEADKKIRRKRWHFDVKVKRSNRQGARVETLKLSSNWRPKGQVPEGKRTWSVSVSDRVMGQWNISKERRKPWWSSHQHWPDVATGDTRGRREAVGMSLIHTWGIFTLCRKREQSRPSLSEWL